MATQTIQITMPTIQPDWLEQRRQFIGGSDSASLFPEDSKYGCDVRLFFDKTGHAPDYPRTPKEENILKRGHIWEAVVALYFQESTGLKVRRIGARQSKEHPAMGVNMDRQIIGVTTEQLKSLWPNSAEIQAMEGECGPGYLECKTANEWMFKSMMESGVPHDYILQVNHGLVVTDYRWGVFAVLEPSGGNFAAFPYVFKANLAAEQIRRAESFWAALEANQMPSVKVSDNRCRSCVYRRSCPRSKELLAERDKEFTAEGYAADNSPELVELLADYKEAAEVADQKAETVDSIKARIKQVLGDRQKVEVSTAGARVSFATTKPPMRWDGKALEGTTKDLARYDIPTDARCEEPTGPEGDGQCGEPASLVVAAGQFRVAYFMCESCGFKAVKHGAALVARKDVASVVASCRRAGEPSRPLKIVFA